MSKLACCSQGQCSLQPPTCVDSVQHDKVVCCHLPVNVYNHHAVHARHPCSKLAPAEGMPWVGRRNHLRAQQQQQASCALQQDIQQVFQLMQPGPARSLGGLDDIRAGGFGAAVPATAQALLLIVVDGDVHLQVGGFSCWLQTCCDWRPCVDTDNATGRTNSSACCTSRRPCQLQQSTHKPRPPL